MESKSVKKVNKKKSEGVRSNEKQTYITAVWPNDGKEEERNNWSLAKKKKIKAPKKDDRFESVFSDPRFDSLANKERKVTIDKRFKSMLSSEKFGTKCAVDMRGRRIKFGAKNTLEHLYDFDESTSAKSDSEVTSAEEEREIKIDLARGNGNVTSSDEDSGSEWEFSEEEESGVEHKWGELDRGASRVEWATRRLALCNMEWDRISAKDIFVVLSSFKPSPPAEILSVTIFLSDFGKERLEEEEKIGPRILQLTESIDDVGEFDKRGREALRTYQLDRMRYYYAVIECDRMQTAATIYEQCDGVEFESSAVRMDLRFVPDEMTFEGNVVKERVTQEDVDVNMFKPKFFESAALSKSATKLTWDETDPERIKAQREAFLPDANLDELEHMIAPGSSDEENDAGSREMMSLFNTKENSEEKEVGDMEVSWEAKEEEEQSGLQKTSKNDSSELTPWQKYLQKRKQKRKERKALIAQLKKKRKVEREEMIVTSDERPRQRKHSIGEENHETPVVDDERFAALYTDSAFAIDQSNPLFKSSKLIEKQVSEKKQRKMLDEAEKEITSLADKLKEKTERMNKNKKKRLHR
ncbi:ESF1 -like protein [Toxocara canis]|uniref:ESF1-like protein n=1 Tax=Toxocara canis TaxID=6265 RepID=A0A0B2V6X2_TOXCA|nr:ESF1 -like protein [Toxocara canis]